MNIPFKKALLAATVNPAKALGVDRELGSISVGKYADYLLLNNALELEAVFQAGKRIAL